MIDAMVITAAFICVILWASHAFSSVKTATNDVNYTSFYNPQALKLFEWALESNNRVQSSKMAKVARRMEKTTRNLWLHGSNTEGHLPSMAIPKNLDEFIERECD